MKNLIKRSIIYALLVILIIGLSSIPVMTQGSIGANNGTLISVTINGLEKGDKATLILSPEMDESPGSVIVEKAILGKGETIIIDLIVDLKDGNYQLVIDTSDKYFRTPKGYLFKLIDGELVNARNRSIEFDLIPPLERQYKPYRGPVMVESTSELTEPKIPTPGDVPFRMEYFLSLSLLPKQGEPDFREGTRSSGSHYVGPYNTYDCEGIWGDIDVVDTGVRHDIHPYAEYVCDRVYASRWISGIQHWMEIGWMEYSEQLDYRYLYEFDSSEEELRLYFQISSSHINVALMQSSGNYWRALYWNGSDWVSMAYENIGFSSADTVYNRGEVYTYDGTHPNFPTAYTTTNEIYVDDSWDTWDDDYDDYTFGDDDDPYNYYMITDYYYFYIYTE